MWRIMARRRSELIAAGHRYDVVLMDCQMPVMDGFQAVAKIREIEYKQGQPRLPILALTAHSLDGDREKCLQAGMDDYLSKPISQKALVEAIEKWCARGTNRDAAAQDPVDEPALRNTRDLAALSMVLRELGSKVKVQ